MEGPKGWNTRFYIGSFKLSYFYSFPTILKGFLKSKLNIKINIIYVTFKYIKYFLSHLCHNKTLNPSTL